MCEDPFAPTAKDGSGPYLIQPHVIASVISRRLSTDCMALRAVGLHADAWCLERVLRRLERHDPVPA